MTREECINNLREIVSDMPSDQCADWIEAVLTAIEALQEQRWIPVSERLPEEDCKTYLVCCADGYIASIMYDRSIGWLLDSVIVAWMQLPKPYKAESEE